MAEEKSRLPDPWGKVALPDEEGIPSSRRVMYASKKAGGRLGGARGRGRQIIRGQDGEAWMWAG